ncbi:MAG TPA: galactose-1-epimerase, partial [Albitalea sp.]|nr:galactose-1-epimerase [Albitalea sp.]
LACDLPMPDGTRRSVILSRAALPAAQADSAYLGATIGRYANRIAHARIGLGERRWALVPNPGSRHQLHGGLHGFHTRAWQVEAADERAVRFSLVSADGDEGYPGELQVQIAYRLLDPMTIEMEASATVSAPSPVCLTNHAYFNLDGSAGDARAHRLRIAASRFLPVDAELIPIGALNEVADTGFDFRDAKTLQRDWLRDPQQHLAGGFDHAFLLDPACAGMNAPAAVLESSDGALSMEIRTTLPALQLYGGQYLEGFGAPCPGIALEPQFLPDSPNHPEWPQPTCWLHPGQQYRHTIRYRFSPARSGAPAPA